MIEYVAGPQLNKAATTAETLRFAKDTLPKGRQVRAFIIDTTGAGNDVDSLTEIRVKAGGQDILRLNELELAALLSTFGKKAEAGASAARFTIPFYLGSPAFSAPEGQGLTIEIDTDATGAAGVFSVTTQVETSPDVLKAYSRYPVMLGQTSEIAASAVNAGFTIQQTGVLWGFMLARSTSIDGLTLRVGTKQVADFASGNSFLESQELISGTTVTLNKLWLLPNPMEVTEGTQIVLTVDGSWVTTDRVVICTHRAQGQ